ncbi:unnamed protein product [Strongylus vulgaris]|uniref:Uncharacterized protein n=1 Tax=Strongylus vulgaris TaxID=40348 RepID=A0A3P7J285_STRVU|nr:unnamed protein product [Strongylus vulgaris]
MEKGTEEVYRSEEEENSEELEDNVFPDETANFEPTNVVKETSPKTEAVDNETKQGVKVTVSPKTEAVDNETNKVNVTASPKTNDESTTKRGENVERMYELEENVPLKTGHWHSNMFVIVSRKEHKAVAYVGTNGAL